MPITSREPARDRKLEKIRKLFYSSFSEDDWSNRMRALVSADSRVLEIGAGSGEGYQQWINYKSLCHHSVGIDLDPRVLDNPNFHVTEHISAYEIDRFAGEPFDVLLSDMVAEHIDDADKFVQKQLVLMDTNSVAVHRTVNKYYYSSLANYVIPDKLKYFLVEKLGAGRPAEDVFPACYLLNSKKDLLALAERHDCEIEVERFWPPPGYLRRSYLLMMLYVIVDLPLAKLFPGLRSGIIFTIRKT